MKRPQWLTRGRVVVGCGVALTLAGAIALGYKLGFTGLGANETVTKSEKSDKQGNVIERTTSTTFQDGKTLWDWFSLLGVPLSLVLLGAWLQYLQQERNNKEAEVEKDIAAENRREEAIQTYFDRVSTLLVEKNLLAIGAKSDTATPEQKELLAVSVDVIRARTLSTLRRLEGDGQRKTSLIRFLLEAEGISKLKLDLSGADLSGADLFRADLNGAKLSEAKLSEAKLAFAKLRGAVQNRTNFGG